MCKLILTNSNMNQKTIDTSLVDSVFTGNIGAVKHLIKNGANLSVRSIIGLDLVAVALENNYLDLAKYLVDMGCKLDSDKARSTIYRLYKPSYKCKFLPRLSKFEKEVDKRIEKIRKWTSFEPEKWIFANYETYLIVLTIVDKTMLLPPEIVLCKICRYLFC